MTKEEFRKYVIAEATKYLFSNENEVSAKSPKTIKENVENNSFPVTASDIKNLAEEMKKINKKIDLRNPLISENNDSLVESIIKDNKKSAERQLDVDGLNKKKHIAFQNEGEKDKWNRMLKYNVPIDEERD